MLVAQLIASLVGLSLVSDFIRAAHAVNDHRPRGAR